MYFDGGPFERLTHRWYHMCVTADFTEKGAIRQFYLDGELNFEIVTEFLSDVKWPKGHNLTIGGREFEYYHSALGQGQFQVNFYPNPKTNWCKCKVGGLTPAKLDLACNYRPLR